MGSRLFIILLVVHSVSSIDERKALEGTAVILPCFGNVNEVESGVVRWYKAGLENPVLDLNINEDKHIQYSNDFLLSGDPLLFDFSLSILNVQMQNAGTYSCLGINGENYTEINTVVLLVKVPSTLVPVPLPELRHKPDDNDGYDDNDSYDDNCHKPEDGGKFPIAAIVVPVVIGILLVAAIVLGIILYKKYSHSSPKKLNQVSIKKPIPKAVENIYEEKPYYINFNSFPIE
ncbi:uncharacterized protein [Lepisosteus oculatus]|uniref:uncharacterized protein n=1 Tax=Lepisosteus oculatus TaxID=7918 RepID=UPI0007400D67|nr:PREDICTED: uncharacterized protein LOC107075915 [Lepisosteus oculatus]